MGGDHAPSAILKGCWEAAPLLDKGDTIILVGDEKISRDGLDSSGLSADKKGLYKIVHTTEVISMDESPVEAIRSKPDSSISVMCKLVARGEADVVISAGHTRAGVAGGPLRVGELPGLARPGIAGVGPTFHRPVVH